MAKKGAYYARRFILGKKFGINGTEKGPEKLYYGISHALFTCNIANACLQNANIHNYAAVQTYNITTGCAVCTDSAIA